MARGAPIYAELTGFGMSADAGDITAIDPDGAARAMRCGFDRRQGSIPKTSITSMRTAPARRSTTRARRWRCTGRSATAPRDLAVSSSKGVLGHSLGAAGALELAATALALHHQTIPPTANFEEVDPDCDLDYVPNTARNSPIQNAMSSSFAFGGLNAVLVLGRA